MSTVRKFTFDVSFDDGFDAPAGRDDARLDDERGDQAAAASMAAPPPAPPPEPEPEPEPEPPAATYTEEDLQLAREDAYVAGHAAALEEATVTQGRAVAQAVQVIADHIPALQDRVAAANAEIAELAARVAVEVCRKILPHCPEDYAAREIEALVLSLLPSLANQPRLVVRVGARLAAAVRRVLDGMADRTGFDGRIVVLEDPSLADGEARVEWGDGGAERNTTRLWAEIDALIERNIPHFSRGEALELPEPEPEPEAEAEALADAAAEVEDVWPEIDAEAWWTPPSSGFDAGYEDDFADADADDMPNDIEMEAAGAPIDDAAAADGRE